MGLLTGAVTAGLQLGLESVLVRPTRNLGPFEAQVWLEEQHEDEMEITDHPVEMGAQISDHAYMRPSQVTIRCGWSNSPSVGGGGGIGGLIQGAIGGILQTVPGLASMLSGADPSAVRAVYRNILALQSSRVPFDILTGKRSYDNMLIKSIRETTGPETENCFLATVVCRQVQIARTQIITVSAPKSAQKDPGSTVPPQDKGTKALQPGATFSPAAAPKIWHPPPNTKVIF